jgi:copper chaperone CopZ
VHGLPDHREEGPVAQPGVTEVSVSIEKRQVTVVFDDTRTTVDALTGATADAGYPSTAETAGAT